MRFEPSPPDRYINELYAPEDAMLQRVRAVGESLYPGMQISPYEGQLLHLLVCISGARRIIEIGSFVGYSALCMARALPEDGELVTFEYQENHAAYAREHLSAYAQVRVVEGNALEKMAQETGTFDLAFIDAEKRSYEKYLDLLLPKLRSGALIIADNTLLFGAMLGEVPKERVSPQAIDAMRAFNARLADRREFVSVMLPTSQGLTLAQKR